MTIKEFYELTKDLPEDYDILIETKVDRWEELEVFTVDKNVEAIFLDDKLVVDDTELRTVKGTHLD